MKIILGSVLLVCTAFQSAFAVEVSANPIRRVVTMLQSMQKKIEAEAEKEKSMFEKYMCYCKTSSGTLEESISAGETKVPQLSASLEESKSKKAQLDQEVKDHKAAREDAALALGDAHALREKEAKEFDKESSDYKANIEALTKAIAAISKGMAGSFLQTSTAQVVRQLVIGAASLNSVDRDLLMGFLQGGARGHEGYAPQSGEIVGMLKQIKERMEKDLASITEAEESAKANSAELQEAKGKELVTHTVAIEEKTERVGKLGVEIAEMANDLEDTEAALAEDKQFLADMDKNCADKEKEWNEITKMRNEETLAIAETIKILNDDEALELFKKTLPSPSFMQMVSSTRQVQQKALAMVKQASRGRAGAHRPALDLIAMALTGRKVSFDKVFKLIDDLIVVLDKEQVADNKKKEECEQSFDSADDKKKELEHAIDDLTLSIDDTKSSIETLTEEIKALIAGIAALDKDVAESTETRKEEHEAYLELMSSDSAAKKLIGVAKNRLNKFYNPKLYEAPPKRVLSEEDQIVVNFGGTAPPTEAPGGIAGTGVMALVQLHSHSAGDAAPPPPPESFAPYAKKAQMSNGVIAMLDMLVADLDKEMTEAEVAEKNSQAEYETFMKDAAEKRAQDSKTVSDKEAAKAEAESDLHAAKETKSAKTADLMATEEYIASLHQDCDWLLKNFDLRKEARAGEVESLKAARAVLAGADYSFVQKEHSRVMVRGAGSLRGSL